RKAPHDAVTDVEAHERQELGSRRLELLGRTVVAAPVLHEVGGENAAAGHRRDLRYPGQDAGLAKKPHQAQVIESGPEATPGEGEAKLLYGIAHEISRPNLHALVSLPHQNRVLFCPEGEYCRL